MVVTEEGGEKGATYMVTEEGLSLCGGYKMQYTDNVS